MKQFTKQLIFVSLGAAILVAGGLAIWAATVGGNLKVNPILGHDLDLNALYYGQAANNTVHDITTQDISISAWVKLDTDASILRNIVIKRNASSLIGYVFRTGTTGLGGNLRFDMLDNTGHTVDMYTTQLALLDNKWHYVSVVIDRDTAANCKMYVDGLSIPVFFLFGTVPEVINITNDSIFSIGGASSILDGQIRDVKLYYATGDHWTDAQVLYQAQHPFDYTANAGTLTDYWRLDEGTGTTLYGKVNNLTLSNVLAWTTQPKIKMVNQENTTSTSNNPVGWWKMDEGTAIHGSSVADSSGYGNTGTLSTGDGSLEKSVAGKLGKGLLFDGVDDYVNMGNVASYNLANTNHTLSVWFKVPSLPSEDWASILFRFTGGTPGAGYLIYMRSATGYLGFEERSESPAAGSITISPSGNYADNKWHLVTVVVDIVAKTGYMYVDGVFILSDTYLLNLIDRNDNLNIGGNTTFTNWYGSLDDVRIYNRALSAGEVSQMFNSTKDGYLGKIKVSTGLVGYWKLDDNNALTSVIDYSGKGNTGTAYSGTATSTSVLSTSTAMIGRAMSFDGGDDWVDVGSSPTLHFNKPFTVSAWIKLTALPANYAMIIGDYNGAYRGYRLYVEASPPGGVRIDVGRGSDSTMGGIRSVQLLSVGTWYHVVGVYDGVRPNIYVNSVKTTGNLYSPIEAEVNTTRIGRAIWTTWYFNGLIDEVKIWNYARTAEQIGQDYQRGVKGLP